MLYIFSDNLISSSLFQQHAYTLLTMLQNGQKLNYNIIFCMILYMEKKEMSKMSKLILSHIDKIG